MKISINNACNSKCPYCFAGTMGIKQGSEMDPENFKKILDWMVLNNDRFICLLGGEPTINPNFKEYMEMISGYMMNFDWTFLLLTNGVLLDECFDYLPARTALLVNVNSSKVLNNAQYEHLKRSLTYLKNRVPERFLDRTSENPMGDFYVLGCNLHAEEDNYDFFWDLVDLTNCHTVRVSVASPQNNKYLYDRESYFKLMKERFMTFIDEADKRNCKVNLDCSLIPICNYDGRELYKIFKVTENEVDDLCGCNGSTFQVLPDMTISCCFGDDDFNNAKVQMDFNKTYSYYEKLIESRRQKQVPNNYLKKCENCEYKKRKLCFAGCFGFKDGIKNE